MKSAGKRRMLRFDGLHERACGDAVKFREVTVQNDRLAANQQNGPFDDCSGDNEIFGHGPTSKHRASLGTPVQAWLGHGRHDSLYPRMGIRATRRPPRSTRGWKFRNERSRVAFFGTKE